MCIRICTAMVTNTERERNREEHINACMHMYSIHGEHAYNLPISSCALWVPTCILYLITRLLVFRANPVAQTCLAQGAHVAQMDQRPDFHDF